MRQDEAIEQSILFNWARVTNIPGNCEKIDEHLIHIPNGGSRNFLEAVKLKRQGVKAGFPDICLFLMRGGYGGLIIEMKKKGRSVVTDKQKEWIERLRRQGYMACVTKGWEEARDVILSYLKLSLPNLNEHGDA